MSDNIELTVVNPGCLSERLGDISVFGAEERDAIAAAIPGKL